MSGTTLERSFYLAAGADWVFVTFHPAAAEAATDTAVIVCPPFGWEEVCSYRCRREWALSLAQSGYPTLRVTLPSTGDSGGAVRDPDRLTAWNSGIDESSRWLRRATGTRRTVAIGMGLGGMLAYRSAALGAELDDLVLWATPARGRAVLRQLRAFSKLETTQFFEALPEPPPLPDGEVEAGGFALSAQTVQELDQLDLTALPLTDAADRRVLLLERDGIAVDLRLRDRLENAGASTTCASGNGYADMTSHPQQAKPATEVFASVTSWIGESSCPLRSSSDDSDSIGALAGATATRNSAAFGVAGKPTWTETPVSIEQPSARLAGVLVEPSQPATHGLCAVLLNAGAVRRIGPSRMWVETARRWAACGVPTLRLDVEGIGDADGPAAPYEEDGSLYTDGLVPQVLGALDYLQDSGAGEVFLLGGLCAGAYWAFHAALDDSRVCAALMLNPRALVWDETLAPSRYFRTLVYERPSIARIRTVATRARVVELLRWTLGAPRRRLARLISSEARALAMGSDTDRLLERLRTSGKRVTLLFSEREPLYNELLRAGSIAKVQSWPNVTLERVAVADHTLRPSWAQSQAQAAMDRALARELEITGVHPSVPGSPRDPRS